MELIKSYASEASKLLLVIAHVGALVDRMVSRGTPLEKTIPTEVSLPYLDQMEHFCIDLGLDHGLNRLKRIRAKVAKGIDFKDFRVELETLDESVTDQLKDRKFLYVPRADMYEADDLFGIEVSMNFGKSDFHIKEAGTCLAVGRATGSVYHSMCVLEAGLDSLSYALGIPLSQKNWNVILSEIETKIAAMGPHSGSSWKTDKEFYSSAAIEFKYFREAWRNHTAHGRSKFTESEALKVFEHVSDFMAHLAKRLSERP